MITLYNKLKTFAKHAVHKESYIIPTIWALGNIPADSFLAWDGERRGCQSEVCLTKKFGNQPRKWPESVWWTCRKQEPMHRARSRSHILSITVSGFNFLAETVISGVLSLRLCGEMYMQLASRRGLKNIFFASQQHNKTKFDSIPSFKNISSALPCRTPAKLYFRREPTNKQTTTGKQPNKRTNNVGVLNLSSIFDDVTVSLFN